MFPVIAGLCIVSLAELTLWVLPVWNERRVAAVSFGTALVVGTVTLVAINPAAWTLLIAVLTGYRVVNLARMAAGHVQEDYLFHTSRRTSLWLIGGQAAVAAAAALSRHAGIGTAEWRGLAAALALAGAIVILISSIRNMRAALRPRLTRAFTDKALPALTVAIPARNETEDLEECLQSLISRTYPKLEILVLDDCSQDKRTPEIIRGFAHAGVRFISGSEPPKSWLAKNFAYDRLADEASGDVLLFCGVDVRFKPGSLNELVKILLQGRQSMVSILPRNALPKGGGLPAWFMQANRYAWELSVPRLLVRRPPVLSTCWLITRQALDKAGGFEAVRRKGIPVSYFARSAARAHRGYSFLRSDAAMGISSAKAADNQRATAVRTRYLQMHRRPEVTALISLGELAVIILPFALLVTALIAGERLTAGLSALSIIAGVAAYSRVFNLTYRRFMLRGLWLLPLAALYDVWLLNYSMWLYEFREVIWKGRNVCIPVMRAIPKLPSV
jgi:glycosyltransferase involved in cell wall biosynthesis